jgi:hypothetical protein
MLPIFVNNKINRNKIKKNEKTKQLTLTTFLLTCLAFNASNAQDIKSSTAAFGFKALNFSNLYTDNVDDNNVLTGFNAGLYAKFQQIPFPYNLKYRIPLKVLNLAIIMLLQTEQLRLKQIILKFLYCSFSTLQMHSTYMLDHMQLTW